MTDREFRREIRRALVKILVGTRKGDETFFWLTVARSLPIIINAVTRRYSEPSSNADHRMPRPSR